MKSLIGAALVASALAVAGLHPATGGYLGQSLRNGSQTPEHLFCVGHPLIGKLQARIGQAVSRYIQELPQDARHPFLSRRRRQPNRRSALRCRRPLHRRVCRSRWNCPRSTSA